MRQVALPRPAPGEWAVVNQPPLGPLPDDLAQRLRDPVGEPGALSSMVIGADDEPAGEAPDELYLDCLDAALALVAGRLDNELVREQPRNSGVVALRLRPGVLEIAPALEEEGWLGRSLRVELDAVRLDGEEAGEPDVEFGETTVTLAGRAIALPCAHAIWGAAATAATVPVTLPKAWLPGVPDQHISVLLTL